MGVPRRCHAGATQVPRRQRARVVPARVSAGGQRGAHLRDGRLRLGQELQGALVQLALPHAPRRHRLAHQRARVLGLRVASRAARARRLGRRLGLSARDGRLDACAVRPARPRRLPLPLRLRLRLPLRLRRAPLHL